MRLDQLSEAFGAKVVSTIRNAVDSDPSADWMACLQTHLCDEDFTCGYFRCFEGFKCLDGIYCQRNNGFYCFQMFTTC